MKPWNFEDITKPLVKAVRFAYSARRKNKNKDIPWSGPQLTINRILAGCYNIDESFKKENLKYNNQEQGRDALNTIIGCAVQLGIEQGIRMKMQDLNRHKMLVQTLDSQDAADRIDLYIRESGLS